jgi:hypothetical protein
MNDAAPARSASAPSARAGVATQAVMLPSARAGVATQAVTALAGAAMVVVPALVGSSWGQAAAAVGLLGVIASLWRVLAWASLVAVAAAIAGCVICVLAAPLLAADGLLILGYLLLLDIPRPIPAQAIPRWVRRQRPLALAGLATSGAVMAGLALPVAGWWWLVLPGIAAAVAATAIALPR